MYVLKTKMKKILYLAVFVILIYGLSIVFSNISFSGASYDDTNEIKNKPLIFIGGYERSGTTLIRAILDVHDDVVCGPETKIIPTVVNFVGYFLSQKINQEELKSAKLEFKVIHDAMAHFIYHIMNNHIRKAPRLCAKDPKTLIHMDYLHNLFPKAKFIYMIRNGRGSAYSLLLKMKLPLNFEEYLKLLQDWGQKNEMLYRKCTILGPNICKMVYYENLVQNKEKVLKEIISFLDLKWNDKLLNHEKYINKKIVISNMEWSNDQINRSIYLDSLENWKGKIPGYNEEEIKRRVPILSFLGY